MSSERVYQLGLFVRRSAAGLEADLSLESESLVNPITGMRIEQASFMVVGERLMALDPPELVGLPPLALADFDTAGQLRNWVVADFKRMLSELERRSAELRALGISPEVDPETLHLTAGFGDAEARFDVSSDKRGNFRIARVQYRGKDLGVSGSQTFELSEFTDAPSLIRNLRSLVGLPFPPEVPKAAAAPAVHLSEVARVFGDAALVPPRTPLELLIEFRARGRVYRFAAARVKGHTFRGLLAGPEGKVWAERFELEQFPGIVPFASGLLGVDEHEIELSRGSED